MIEKIMKAVKAATKEEEEI